MKESFAFFDFESHPFFEETSVEQLTYNMKNIEGLSKLPIEVYIEVQYITPYVRSTVQDTKSQRKNVFWSFVYLNLMLFYDKSCIEFDLLCSGLKLGRIRGLVQSWLVYRCSYLLYKMVFSHKYMRLVHPYFN